MSMYYSDPEREDDDHALPDVEVFYLDRDDFWDADEGTWMYEARENLPVSQLVGYYVWYCYPGCLPDSDPLGPFATEREAVDAVLEDID